MEHLMQQSIQLAANTGKNFSNETTHGTPTTVKARVQEKFQTIRDANGEERVSSAEIWLPASTTIDLQYQVTYDEVDREIIAIQPAVDGAGVTRFKKVFV